MPWIEPKTNWEVKPYGENGEYRGDWFSVDVDYARVTGNIRYLADIAHIAVAEVPQYFTVEGPTEVVFNTLEGGIGALWAALWQGGYFPPTRYWAGNGTAPTVEDWNRWEESLRLLYEHYAVIERNKPRLPMRLNGGRF